MKAKFVYENVHFERGRDPMATMGIGERARILDVLGNGGFYNLGKGGFYDHITDDGPILRSDDYSDVWTKGIVNREIILTVLRSLGSSYGDYILRTERDSLSADDMNEILKKFAWSPNDQMDLDEAVESVKLLLDYGAIPNKELLSYVRQNARDFHLGNFPFPGSRPYRRGEFHYKIWPEFVKRGFVPKQFANLGAKR
jgi:hypothetical protein